MAQRAINYLLWCPRWDLNPYGFLHSILSRTRIPIPPLGPNGHLEFLEAPPSGEASQGAEQTNESLLSVCLEAPTGIEPVYKVLQTSA